MCHLVTDSSTVVQKMAYQMLHEAAAKRTEYIVVEAAMGSESTASPELPLELVLLLQQDPIQDDEVVDISVRPQLSSLRRVDPYLSVRACLVTCWDGC